MLAQATKSDLVLEGRYIPIPFGYQMDQTGWSQMCCFGYEPQHSFPTISLHCYSADQSVVCKENKTCYTNVHKIGKNHYRHSISAKSCLAYFIELYQMPWSSALSVLISYWFGLQLWIHIRPCKSWRHGRRYKSPIPHLSCAVVQDILRLWPISIWAATFYSSASPFLRPIIIRILFFNFPPPIPFSKEKYSSIVLSPLTSMGSTNISL